MKQVPLFVLIVALAGAPAMASTLCASAAGTGTSGGGSAITGVNDPALNVGSCANDTAVTISVTNDSTQSAIVKWHASAPFPAGLTLGTLASLDANVAFSADVTGDQPFYVVAFTAADNSLAGTSTGDIIELFEDQSGNVSGGAMAANANTTLFDAYDFNTGSYLAIAEMADPVTLTGLLGLDSGLSSDALYALDIEIGADGGCGNPSACSESLTINSLDVEETAVTPEPSSALLVGSGMLFLAGAFTMRQRRIALLS